MIAGDIVNGGGDGDDMSSALVYMVRISDSHSDGPGSIPGCGTFLFLHTHTYIKYPMEKEFEIGNGIYAYF